MHFVNEYLYTESIIKESCQAYWKKKYGIARLNVLSLLMLILYVIFRHPAILILGLGAVLMTAMFQFKARGAAKAEIDNLKKNYPSGNPTFHVEIGDKILMKTEKMSASYAFSDVENLVQTKTMTIVMFKGSKFIPLPDSGFKEGCPGDCYAYICEKTRE